MATVLITGGTGLIGKALTHLLLERGHRVIVLSRKPVRGLPPVPSGAALTHAVWNVQAGRFPGELLSQTDYIVHLAGANVGKGRWTKRRRAELVRSRTVSSALLVEALRAGPNQVKGVISASAVGWYGPDVPGHPPFRESDPSAPDFLGRLCRDWEGSLALAPQLGKRLVIFRTGLVLSREGGILPSFLTPLRAGIGPIPGDGNQVISWIHLQDLCRLYLQAVENPAMEGVYNAVAPAPVSNKALVLFLARRLRGRFFIPIHVPAFLLRIALGGMSVEVLKSCTVDAQRIRNTGFQFAFPTMEAALENLISAK